MFKKFTDSAIINAHDLHDILSAGHDTAHGVAHGAPRAQTPRADIKVIDATFVLPNDNKNPAHRFADAHIAGAQFFDITANTNPDSDVPNTLPTPPDFARTINAMGISNDDFIVVYAQSDMVMGAARLWWMFRVYGHTNICVLNGGLPAWRAAGYPINNTPDEPPSHSPKFSTDFQDHLFTDIKAVRRFCDSADGNEMSANGTGAPPPPRGALIDARPAARYGGQTPEPRAGIRAGHIPRSTNIPAKSLVDNTTGLLKDKAALIEIFTARGVLDAPSITVTCGSGITACMLALALFNVGRKDVSVYDGSWSEWGNVRCDTPIATSA